jgi:hypothetical protein
LKKIGQLSRENTRDPEIKLKEGAAETTHEDHSFPVLLISAGGFGFELDSLLPAPHDRIGLIDCCPAL